MFRTMRAGLAALVALASGLWGGALAAAPEPIPAEVLFTEDKVPTVAMSPDGKRVAALVNGVTEDGEGSDDRVVVIDLEDGASTAIPTGKYPIRTIDWASPKHLLIGLTMIDDHRGVTYVTGSRMLSVNVETTATAVMFENQRATMRRSRYLSSIANRLPDDPTHVLMPSWSHTGNHLWRVNIETGAAELHEKGRAMTVAWFTDRDGRAALRIDANRNGRYFYVLARQDDGDWKKVRTVRIGSGRDEDDRDFWPIAPAPGENRYYVLAHPEDEEFRTIKIYDYETDAYVETVIDAGDADVRAALTSAQTGELIGARVMRDRIETILLDKRAQAHIEGLDAFFENDANISFWGGSKDGRFALLYVTAPTRPGQFWVYDYEKTHCTYLMDVTEGIDEQALGRMEVARYTARDGTPLDAYLTHPAGVAADAPAPLVVLVHGGPEARDAYDFSRAVQFLASRGYRVLQPYFRGSSGRGRRFAEAGYKQWGALMQDDVTDAVRHLHAQGLATPQDTCIVGASYGGYAALYGGATTPELYACVASLAGVTDLVAQLRHDRREHGQNSDVYAYWLKALGDLREDKARLQRTSPVRYAESYPLPVHLAHGAADDNVPVEQSRAMAKALKRAGRPHEYHEYPGEGHSFRDWETDQAYWTSLAAFLAEHAGGQP